jgi:hypothetical protein
MYKSQKPDYVKESRESRKERLSFVGTMATKVIRDKSKYTRKVKHK